MASTDLVLQRQEREWKALDRRARTYASSSVVARELQGNVENTRAVLVTCEQLGLPQTLPVVGQFHVYNGTVEPGYQMVMGLAAGRGHRVRLVRSSSVEAVVEITRKGDPDSAYTSTFTIEDARRAGLLDEWVERWTDTGETWRDSGKPKRTKETFVLDREGVDEPEWVTKERRAGNVKRMDNWHKWPEDMVISKAVKRAVRRVAPDALYGLDLEVHVDDVSLAYQEATQAASEFVRQDDQVVDAELLDDDGNPIANDATTYPSKGGGDDGAETMGEPSSPVETSRATGPSETAAGQGAASPKADGSGSEPTPAREASGGAGAGDRDPGSPLVDEAWTKSFAIGASNVEPPPGATIKQVRHAIASHAVGRTIESAKEIRTDEAALVMRTLSAVRGGRLQVVRSGNEVAVEEVPA